MTDTLTISDDHSPEVKAEFERLKEAAQRGAKSAHRAQTRLLRAQHEFDRSADDFRDRYNALTAFVEAHHAPQIEMFS